MKRFFSEIHGLVWTLAGTGMVLITLSGKTRVLGWQITLVALTVHLVGVFIKEKNE